LKGHIRQGIDPYLNVVISSNFERQRRIPEVWEQAEAFPEESIIRLTTRLERRAGYSISWADPVRRG
jgi:hypothetical protein